MGELADFEIIQLFKEKGFDIQSNNSIIDCFIFIFYNRKTNKWGKTQYIKALYYKNIFNCLIGVLV